MGGFGTRGGGPKQTCVTMPYGLYLSAQGAQVQSRLVEVITNNLANVETVGFKRELGVLESRYAKAMNDGLASPGDGSVDNLGGGVSFRETKTDFSPGPVRHTGVDTDLTIQGDGFFAVRKGQETCLTRAGNFRLTSQGELVTQQGYSVMGEGNVPIIIKPDAGPWRITPTGEFQQGGVAQPIVLVKPKSLSDLARAGENLFRPLAPTEAVPPAERSVAAGCLEMSGVQPTTEMTALIEASRLFEANVNMMKTQDQALGGLVNRILKA
jgi:flagellar basal-body rod protein FlgF